MKNINKKIALILTLSLTKMQLIMIMQNLKICQWTRRE